MPMPTSRAIRTARWCSVSGACSWRATNCTASRRTMRRRSGTSGAAHRMTGSSGTSTPAIPTSGIAVFVGLHLVLFGAPGIIMIAVHLSAQPFFAAGVINGLGHAVGYRSFEMPSTATNLVPWGLLLAGEELHNNHHAFPCSARFAVQRWELDIGWLWIRLLRALRLARVRGWRRGRGSSAAAASSATRPCRRCSPIACTCCAPTRARWCCRCAASWRARNDTACPRAPPSSSSAIPPCLPRRRAAAWVSCWTGTRCCAG